jgi:signal transduction histidine kinase
MRISGSTDPSSPETPPSRRDAWERWVSVWHVIFYLTLVLPTAVALLSGKLSSPWLVLGLSLTLGVWYGLIMVWLVPRSRKKQQVAWSLVFLGGALALWFPLARAYPAYYITASSFFGLMWGTLPFGLAVAGNILLTGLIIWLQTLKQGTLVIPPIQLILIGVVMLGWTVPLVLWIRSIMRESTERRHLIEQLETTQRNLAAVEHQAGILQERQRLAQEIHDTLAQGFTSIVMQLEVADQALPDGSGAARSRIQQAQSTARASLAEARRLVLALRPAPLEEASLPEALGRVAERWTQETGIKTDFTVTGDPCPLHPEAEVTLLRAMQEALANVHKHAQARNVSVTLSYMDDQVAMDVHDDGIGFDPENPAHPPNQVGGGFGLRVMQERVAQLGGTLVVESSLGQGATLAIQVPVMPNEKETA